VSTRGHWTAITLESSNNIRSQLYILDTGWVSTEQSIDNIQQWSTDWNKEVKTTGNQRRPTTTGTTQQTNTRLHYCNIRLSVGSKDSSMHNGRKTRHGNKEMMTGLRIVYWIKDQLKWPRSLCYITIVILTLQTINRHTTISFHVIIKEYFFYW